MGDTKLMISGLKIDVLKKSEKYFSGVGENASY